MDDFCIVFAFYMLKKGHYSQFNYVVLLKALHSPQVIRDIYVLNDIYAQDYFMLVYKLAHKMCNLTVK